METTKTTTIQCEEQPNYLLSFWSRLLRLRSLLAALMRTLMARVNQALQAGPDVKVALQEILQSKRLLCGVVIVLLAPLNLLAYKLFDSTVDDRSWYFTSMFWYVHTIGPYLCLMFWSVGAFLMLPVKYKFRYLIMAPCIGISVSMIIHLTFFTYDYKSFHDVSLIPIFSGLLLGSAILIAADYMVYRKYHLKDGNTARIKGIIKAPGIDANTKVIILESLVEESENLYARV